MPRLSRRALRLKEQFARDGVVELRVRPLKVAAHLLLFVVVAAVAEVVVATDAPIVRVLVAVVVVLMVVVVGTAMAEQLCGVGPALRLDRDGLTYRRWVRPLRLPWSDVVGVFPFRDSRLAGPLVAIMLSEEAWEEYRANRPSRMRWIDRLTHYNSLAALIPFKVLSASARDIIALADDRTLDQLSTLTRPARLVLIPDFDGGSPVRLRNGREVAVDALGLTQSIASTLDEWNRRGRELAETAPDVGWDDGVLSGYGRDGRALASQIQAELGPGADVRLGIQLPD